MFRSTFRLIIYILVSAPVFLAACGDDGGVFRVRNTDFFAQEEFSLDFDASGLTSFNLTGVSGSIDISGVSGADQVQITGIRRVESESIEDAEENLSKLKVEHTVMETGVFVETSQPDKTEGRNYIVNYTVTLPKSLVVGVQNVNGALTVESMQEAVTVVNVNGSVGARDIFGSTSISQANGDVDASVTIPLGGSIVIAVANGDIALEIPQSTSAALSATVNVGSISYSNLTFTIIDTNEPNALVGTVGKGNGSIVLATSNGDISISGGSEVDESVIFPLSTYLVIQEFSNVNAAFSNRFHCAEDASGRGGTPVYAIADGVVSYSGPMEGYGWLITIDHSFHGVYSLYGHLSTRQSKIAEGIVRKGDIIAYLADDDEDGSGGNYPDWRPHLHFGIRRGRLDDYPTGGDGRWMAGYTVAYPVTLDWLDPTDFVLENSD